MWYWWTPLHDSIRVLSHQSWTCVDYKPLESRHSGAGSLALGTSFLWPPLPPRGWNVFQSRGCRLSLTGQVPPTACVYKVLLKHGCFSAAEAELGSCASEHVDAKRIPSTVWPFRKKRVSNWYWDSLYGVSWPWTLWDDLCWKCGGRWFSKGQRGWRQSGRWKFTNIICLVISSLLPWTYTQSRRQGSRDWSPGVQMFPKPGLKLPVLLGEVAGLTTPPSFLNFLPPNRVAESGSWKISTDSRGRPILIRQRQSGKCKLVSLDLKKKVNNTGIILGEWRLQHWRKRISDS